MKVFGVRCSEEEPLWSQPDYIEGGYRKIRQVLRIARKVGARGLIVWDRILIAASKSSIEADDDKSGGMMGEARAIATGIRRITTMLGKTGSTLIYINHLMD